MNEASDDTWLTVNIRILTNGLTPRGMHMVTWKLIATLALRRCALVLCWLTLLSAQVALDYLREWVI